MKTVEIITLKRCSRCGFFIVMDEFHADNNWREDQKDVWCKGCKHNSKIQEKFLGTAARLLIEENTLHVPVSHDAE